MKTVIIEIDGIEYQLQHPGAREYFKINKSLQYVTTDGYFQLDNEKLFEYCFGSHAGSSRIVHGPDGKYVDWKNAEFDPDKEKLIPSIEQLKGVWAVVLPSFLGGEYLDSNTEGVKARFKWIDKQDNNHTGNNTEDNESPE